MIIALLVLFSAIYIMYLAFAHPSRIAHLMRAFSFDAAVQTDEGKLEKLLENADKYYQTRDLMAAEKTYLRVLKLNHQSYIAYYRLGLIYSYLNNNSDALECFELATQIKPSVTALHNYGMTLFRYRDYDKAVIVLEKANTKKPSLARYITLARIFRIQDNTQKQIENLQEATKMEKNNNEIKLLLADAYLHNHQEPEAMKLFRAVLRDDPNNARARQAIEH